jgi:hypothetical protein
VSAYIRGRMRSAPKGLGRKGQCRAIPRARPDSPPPAPIPPSRGSCCQRGGHVCQTSPPLENRFTFLQQNNINLNINFSFPDCCCETRDKENGSCCKGNSTSQIDILTKSRAFSKMVHIRAKSSITGSTHVGAKWTRNHHLVASRGA